MLKRIVLLCMTWITAIPSYIVLQLPEGSQVSPWIFFIVMLCVIVSVSCLCVFLDSFSTIHRFMHKKETISKDEYKRKKRQYVLLFILGIVGFGLYFILLEFYYQPVFDGFSGFCIVCITVLFMLFGIIGSIQYNSRISRYIKSFIKVFLLGDSFYYEVAEDENCKDMVKK